MRVRTAGVVVGLMIAAPAFVAPQAAASPGTLATRPYVGMPVCKNGPVTGYTCGTVLAVNVTICYPQGCVHGLARTNMYAAAGDGGAPVYYRTELIGTVVGTAGGSTYFDPI
jgi:hypothetical protein